MSDKIAILQIGMEDWSNSLAIPEKLDWQYLHPEDIAMFVTAHQNWKQERKKLEKNLEQLEKLKEKTPQIELEIKNLRQTLKEVLASQTVYAALILSEKSYPTELSGLGEQFEPYQVFYPSHLEADGDTAAFLRQKMAQSFVWEKRNELVYQLSKILFTGQYGAKLPIHDLQISPSFSGEIRFEGRKYLCLTGDFGEDYRQIAFFRYNIQFMEWQFLNLFLDHWTDGQCQLKLSVSLIPSGATNEIAKEWTFEGSDLRQQLLIDGGMDGYLFISIQAKGQGSLKLGPCHYRWSRAEFGEFILGGERLVDQDLQEIQTYFEPGDFQPPLCVYFSGFRTAEGYEGYWMMKSLKTPFMLICDPRLDGGGFYLGSPELEQAVIDKIQEKLAFLGFDSSQLILSGMSMGTFGALYYGSQLKPYGVVISKPLMNLGNMALRERVERPGGFPTSLDILKTNAGNLSEEAAHRLNERFWSRMTDGVFAGTRFSIAYMREDDYDQTAFEDFVHFSKGTGAKVLGKGYSGRHLDGGGAPNNWFMNQYLDLLKKGFGRGEN